jgi:FG-GAP repeat
MARVWLLSTLLAGQVACNEQNAGILQPPPAPKRNVEPKLRLPFSPKLAAGSPAGNRARRVQLLARAQASASHHYAAREAPTAAGVLRARHPWQRFAASFTPQGTELRFDAARGRPAAAFQLSFVEVGCPSTRDYLPQATRVVVGSTRNRVDREHPAHGLTEWFLMGPLGLEQGVTFARLPDCATREGKVLIQTRATPGWSLALKGPTVSAQHTSGARFRYGELAAFDALDRELPTALATDGERIVVQVDVAGAALPITVDPLVWVTNDESTLSPSDGAAYDQFGASVSLADDVAVVGAYGHENEKGAAYAFFLDEKIKEQKLVATNLTDRASFGTAVATDGSVVFIGAPNQQTPGVGATGVVYFGNRASDGWEEQLRSLPTEMILAPDAFFGGSLALRGDWLLVGAAGSDTVHVYRHDEDWTEQEPLQQPPPHAAPGNTFGLSVAVDGPITVVGAPSTSVGGLKRGAAYVFERAGDAWMPQELLPAELDEDADFGWSVAVKGSRIAVGAPGQNEKSGAVFVFEKQAGSWSQSQSPLTGTTIDARFGWAVALGDGWLAVGQPYGGYGLVFPYAHDARGWVSLPELALTDESDDHEFGAALDFHGRRLLIGALNPHSGEPASSGSARLWSVDIGSECDADSDCQSGHCAQRVCCAVACDDVCRSCNLADTGVASGTCSPIKEKSDPYAQCPTLDCSGNEEERQSLCNGQGACATYERSCGDYVCHDKACTHTCKTNEDCSSSAFCKGSRCLPKAPQGQQCDDATQCLSGFCADGFCCELPCQGQCEACNHPAKPGQCLPTTEPRVGQPCLGDPTEPCSLQECDGQHGDRCRYPAKGTACEKGSCKDGVLTLPATCDGIGVCRRSSPQSCGGYQCSQGQCRTDCVVDEHCADDRPYCVNRVCTSTAPCVDKVTDASGTSCAPYRCEGGHCVERCAGFQDCAEGYSCNDEKDECEIFLPRAAASSESSRGCACSAGTNGLGRLQSALLLMIYAAASRRRHHRFARAIRKKEPCSP